MSSLPNSRLLDSSLLVSIGQLLMASRIIVAIDIPIVDIISNMDYTCSCTIGVKIVFVKIYKISKVWESEVTSEKFN